MRFVFENMCSYALCVMRFMRYALVENICGMRMRVYVFCVVRHNMRNAQTPMGKRGCRNLGFLVLGVQKSRKCSRNPLHFCLFRVDCHLQKSIQVADQCPMLFHLANAIVRASGHFEVAFGQCCQVVVLLSSCVMRFMRNVFLFGKMCKNGYSGPIQPRERVDGMAGNGL